MGIPAKSGAGWTLLEWDSEFFGIRIARVDEMQLASAGATLLQECARERIRCLYALPGAGDIATIRILEQLGFGLIDVRLALVRPLNGAGSTLDANIREARVDDIARLEGIARSSHGDTRFYADPNFPRERCDALYATWIARSCTEGFADIVFVAETEGGQAGGYITCSMVQPDRGQIGLLAVAPELRGSGTGRRLIRQALAWAESRGASQMITVTQGRNISAVRTYERSGFVTERMQLWYHLWLDVSG